MKVKTILANEQVFMHIKEAIKKGEWKVNERIPSEIELSDKFGVNRLTVRMALQKLNSMGILETRIGDGTYVKEFDFRNYIERITEFYVTQGLMDKVCEFRQAIEVECAALAINHATPEELDELGEICKDYERLKLKITNSSDDKLNELVEKDMEFHKKIVSMSHNELFCYAFEVAREPIFQYIFTIVKARIESINEKGLNVPVWNDRHTEIYEAIRAKDFDACKKACLMMVGAHTLPISFH
jgi:GntR family transcriptional repressor for pyruvate dehydrogenase complex